MYTYTWYQWLTFFYLYCFFGWIFESTYVSLKQRHFVNRGFVVGITPVPEQSDPHLYLRRYRRDRTRICHRVCDGTAFQGPLLGLQQPAIQCSRVYLPHLIHRLGLSDDLYDACDPQTDRACRPCDAAHVEPVFRVLRDRDLYL